MVLDIHMIGPNISSVVDGQVLRPRSNLTVTLHHGLYHVVHFQCSTPDIVIGKSFVVFFCIVFVCFPFLSIL